MIQSGTVAIVDTTVAIRYVIGMNYFDVIKHFGGSVTKAATELDVSRVTIYRWQQRGIPREQQAYVQLKTNGALLADLSPCPAET